MLLFIVERISIEKIHNFGRNKAVFRNSKGCRGKGRRIFTATSIPVQIIIIDRRTGRRFYQSPVASDESLFNKKNVCKMCNLQNFQWLTVTLIDKRTGRFLKSNKLFKKLLNGKINKKLSNFLSNKDKGENCPISAFCKKSFWKVLSLSKESFSFLCF